MGAEAGSSSMTNCQIRTMIDASIAQAIGMITPRLARIARIMALFSSSLVQGSYACKVIVGWMASVTYPHNRDCHIVATSRYVVETMCPSAPLSTITQSCTLLGV